MYKIKIGLQRWCGREICLPRISVSSHHETRCFGSEYYLVYSSPALLHSSMVSNRVRVGLFKAGYLGADIQRIRRLLEAGRHRYEFEVATPIRTLGNPDLFGYAYSDTSFMRAITPHVRTFDICVILTGVPLEDNFFTRDIDQRVILCTSDQSEEYRKESNRSIEEYFALSVCPEIISIEFQKHTGRTWEELFHGDMRGCLFDFQGQKSQVVAYLTHAGMCDESRGILSASNVDQGALDFIETFLSSIRKPSFAKSFVSCITSPILGFLYGGLVIGF